MIPTKVYFSDFHGLRFARSMAALSALFVFGLFALSGNTAQAAGDAAAGATKAGTCAACHGMDGNSVNPLWPSLAGQNEAYLVNTLNAFQKRYAHGFADECPGCGTHRTRYR